MPMYVAIPSIVAKILVEEKQMKTSFIWKQIDMGIHNITYQLSKQLASVVKPMVHNEVRQAREIEKKLVELVQLVRLNSV